jgi:23S rRNA pseudouridine1911/1915/1917 synthase
MSETRSTLALTAGGEDEGRRLDVVLVRLVSGVSRSRLQAWIREGRVSVEGRRVRRPGALIAAGARIELVPPAPADPAASAALADHLPVLHADPELIAVDKPAGMLSHPSERTRVGTVADLAAARFGPLPAIQGEDRPGIVHRLDRWTSGVMVLGRTRPALEHLKDQFKHRSVRKTYLALVHGAPRFDSDWIDAPIARPPERRDRYRIAPQGEGRPASTYFEVRERFDGFALLACFPKTGRTHQIRVHLASIAHPVVGDRVYRHRSTPPTIPPEAPLVDRQALHAQVLELEHPATGAGLRFEAPLAQDITALLDWLRTHRG